MADEVRRVETVEDRPRDTVVVKEGRRGGSIAAVVLGIIVILLVILWLWGNPFANDDVDITPEVNVPNEVNVDVPSPDVNLPEVNVNESQNDTEPAPEPTQ